MNISIKKVENGFLLTTSPTDEDYRNNRRARAQSYVAMTTQDVQKLLDRYFPIREPKAKRA